MQFYSYFVKLKGLVFLKVLNLNKTYKNSSKKNENEDATNNMITKIIETTSSSEIQRHDIYTVL